VSLAGSCSVLEPVDYRRRLNDVSGLLVSLAGSCSVLEPVELVHAIKKIILLLSLLL
jgi:hypothetical protein